MGEKEEIGRVEWGKIIELEFLCKKRRIADGVYAAQLLEGERDSILYEATMDDGGNFGDLPVVSYLIAADDVRNYFK